ncbi:hypothetical protein CEV33_2576 [Brucella grignonensis]|uniref:Uncharacterized protein n=1 Tax=Brucella grignonensis TaxID=94627 RepID=A0A256F2C4_9HYPH|nr:hypothetical protein CEV33_2576 [Brucella grignonensis]
MLGRVWFASSVRSNPYGLVTGNPAASLPGFLLSAILRMVPVETESLKPL